MKQIKLFISFHKLSHHSSTFPRSTHLIPQICPVTDALCCRSYLSTEPDLLVLYVVTVAAEDVCALLGAILFLSFTPCFCLSCWLFWDALLWNVGHGVWDSKTEKRNQQNAKRVRRKSNTCASEPDYIYLLWHTWPPAELKIRPIIHFVIICFNFCKFLLAFSLSAWEHLLKLSVIANTAFCCIICLFLHDNGLLFRGCLFLLSFVVLGVPAVA